jgi:hypothetical protein
MSDAGTLISVLAEHLLIHEGGGETRLRRVLRASAWSLPFVMPVVAYVLLDLFTPLFACGCFIIKMLVVFAGAYLGILLANWIAGRGN